MNNSYYIKSKSGAGVVNSDTSAYHNAMVRRQQDKYIKGLEQRITKLETALLLLENTVKEMTK